MNREVTSIFYTDDDEDDRDIFKDAANEISDSLQVTTQNNGDELIRLLRNPPPVADIIFLDLNMPLKNGYEVLEEIIRSKLAKSIPVIIFSTSDDRVVIKSIRQLGAHLYIPKPSSFSSLKKAIKYSLSINWETFPSSAEDFVYRPN